MSWCRHAHGLGQQGAAGDLVDEAEQEVDLRQTEIDARRPTEHLNENLRMAEAQKVAEVQKEAGQVSSAERA